VTAVDEGLPPIGSREHALRMLRELDKLVDALEAGCASPGDPDKLQRRRALLDRATELRERLLAEIEGLPLPGDHEPA
jgi:hypothetical protein